MLALFSAVPVLPAIGTGKVPKTAVEVPLGPWVACSRPWRTTSRYRGSSLTIGAGGEVRLHQPAAVCDQRIEARHLERRHQQVLLTDRKLDRISRFPEPVDLPLLRVGLRRVRRSAPLRRWQQSG